MKIINNDKPIATLKINNLQDLTTKELSDLSGWMSKTFREVNKLHITRQKYSNSPKWSLFPNRKVLVKTFKKSTRKSEKQIAKLAAEKFIK